MAKHPATELPLEFGNAGAVDTEGTGWFVGFSDWSKLSPHDLRHMPAGQSSTGLCVKWLAHAAGDPDGQEKPISTGRTISILVSARGEFRLDFSSDPAFPVGGTVTHSLRREGDYAIWGPGIYHRAFGVEASTILSIRWEPSQGAAAQEYT